LSITIFEEAGNGPLYVAVVAGCADPDPAADLGLRRVALIAPFQPGKRKRRFVEAAFSLSGAACAARRNRHG
jgi:hypothetical protein